MRIAVVSFMLAGVFALGVPSVSSAAPQYADFEVSGWIPYWRSQEGIADTMRNMDTLMEVNPFVYTVRTNGMLNNEANLMSFDWILLRMASAIYNKRFIPTVMWSDSDAMHEVLSDPTKRKAHVQAIVREVYGRNYDGIDIDYEAKYAKTRPHFSQFLKELYAAMGQKWVMCTIESRTPLDSRYSSPESIPSDIEYANDFTEINKYCDRVRIMAYDQERIDLKLNAERGHPYVPVADIAWVEKVMTLAAQDIDKRKLVIGIPTYGYEWDMFSDVQGNTHYSKLWSFNPGYVTEVAGPLNLTPTRTAGGEMMLTYPASQSPDPVIPLPNATRVMVWNDAESIRQKVELARTLGLRGVAIFKIDGGQDPNMWGVLKTITSQ